MGKDNRHKDSNRSDNDEMIARSMEANERDRERHHTRNLNKLWIWLGVLVLIAILLWWIFSIGFFEDTTGYTNFGN